MKQKKLAITVDTVFGLDFFIEKTPERKSGFKPADSDFGGKLFCDLRTEGFAALLRVGFAKQLVLTGTNEVRMKNINRGWATREMLVHDLGADPDRILYMPSEWATSGNAKAIASYLLITQPCHLQFAVVSSHFHLPRASILLAATGIQFPLYPAEAFLLVEDMNRKQEIVERLDGSPLAKRVVNELQGIAHLILGIYKPRK